MKIDTFTHFQSSQEDVLSWKMIARYHYEVHWTGGILRHFRAFPTPEQNPALGVLSRPAHPQVPMTALVKCEEKTPVALLHQS